MNAERVRSYFACMSERTRIQHFPTLLLSGCEKRYDESVLGRQGELIDLPLENERTKHDYKILRVSICLNPFSSVLGLNRKTIQAQVKHIYSTENLDMYTTKRNNSHLGHLSAQTAVITAFLQRYGEVNGQPCPTGRGSTESTCVVILENCNTKKSVYDKYTEECSNMINHAMNHVQHTQTCPEAPAC